MADETTNAQSLSEDPADGPQGPGTLIRQAVHRFRDDPAVFGDIRSRFDATDSDEERVRILMDFATSESELAALLPVENRMTDNAAAITTVTITTVTWPSTAY